jgi:small subunit ribosomal protein S1
MVHKEDYKFTAEAPPDEAWWSAILSDVEGDDYVGETTFSSPEEIATQSIDWKKAEDLYKQDAIIELEVTGYNRGGLLVEDENIKGFVPISHLIEISEETSTENRKAILASYVSRNGARVTGRVTTITNFGVFVDLGGVEGLIHISELSWGRVTHPNDVLSPGQEIEVQVLDLDQSRCRVALSLKRLQPNPWDTAHLHYTVGQVTEATITTIVPYGAFARLEEGLDGLIHISEIQGNPESPDEILSEGQQVQVSILHIDTDRQQLGLRLHTN